MKKTAFLCTLMVLSAIPMIAQDTAQRISVRPVPTKKNPVAVLKATPPVKTTAATPAVATAAQPTSTPPPTAPAPAPSAAQAPVVVQYKLTSVRVRISTGRDNKESPSEVYTKFSLPEQFSSSYCAFAQWNQQNEMPVNSDVEVGLNKYASVNLSLISTKLTMSRPEELRTGGNDILLSDIQQYGGRLMIKYYPHLFTDAWRIENVTLTLEFKDKDNQPHPVYGTRTISFSNAKTFLNAGNERYLICEVGKDLSAMISYTRH